MPVSWRRLSRNIGIPWAQSPWSTKARPALNAATAASCSSWAEAASATAPAESANTAAAPITIARGSRTTRCYTIALVTRQKRQKVLLGFDLVVSGAAVVVAVAGGGKGGAGDGG